MDDVTDDTVPVVEPSPDEMHTNEDGSTGDESQAAFEARASYWQAKEKRDRIILGLVVIAVLASLTAMTVFVVAKATESTNYSQQRLTVGQDNQDILKELKTQGATQTAQGDRIEILATRSADQGAKLEQTLSVVTNATSDDTQKAQQLYLQGLVDQIVAKVGVENCATVRTAVQQVVDELAAQKLIAPSSINVPCPVTSTTAAPGGG